MDWEGINTSPREEASAATVLAYSRMAQLSASLAKYIRSLGYPALPCGNDTAQSIPLAIDAGLGELGRNGLGSDAHTCEDMSHSGFCSESLLSG